MKIMYGISCIIANQLLQIQRLLSASLYYCKITIPSQVEAALIVSPYVDNIMLHCDPFHSYSVALVVPTQQAVENWAMKQGIAYSGFADLCQKEETVKEVHRSLVEVCMFF